MNAQSKFRNLDILRILTAYLTLGLSGCVAHFRYPASDFKPPSQMVFNGDVAVCCEYGCNACRSFDEYEYVESISRSLQSNFGRVLPHAISGQTPLELRIKDLRNRPLPFFSEDAWLAWSHLSLLLTTGTPYIDNNPKISLLCISSTHPEGVPITVESPHLAWFGFFPLVLFRPFYLDQCHEEGGRKGTFKCGMEIERTYDRLFKFIREECL